MTYIIVEKRCGNTAVLIMRFLLCPSAKASAARGRRNDAISEFTYVFHSSKQSIFHDLSYGNATIRALDLQHIDSRTVTTHAYMLNRLIHIPLK